MISFSWAAYFFCDKPTCRLMVCHRNFGLRIRKNTWESCLNSRSPTSLIGRFTGSTILGLEAHGFPVSKHLPKHDGGANGGTALFFRFSKILETHFPVKHSILFINHLRFNCSTSKSLEACLKMFRWQCFRCRQPVTFF